MERLRYRAQRESAERERLPEIAAHDLGVAIPRSVGIALRGAIVRHGGGNDGVCNTQLRGNELRVVGNAYLYIDTHWVVISNSWINEPIGWHKRY
jgi:hypothetical protein